MLDNVDRTFYDTIKYIIYTSDWFAKSTLMLGFFEVNRLSLIVSLNLQVFMKMVIIFIFDNICALYCNWGRLFNINGCFWDCEKNFIFEILNIYQWKSTWSFLILNKIYRFLESPNRLFLKFFPVLSGRCYVRFSFCL